MKNMSKASMPRNPKCNVKKAMAPRPPKPKNPGDDKKKESGYA